MEFKDYYKIMGLSPKASQDEIKQAYRKLARKYHPDVSKEANAEARFKEMKEAYEVLKDPEKRAAYDQLRQGGWQAGQNFNPPPGWEHQSDFRGGGFTGADSEYFSDFFESLFGKGGFKQNRSGRGFQARGEDLHYALNISLEEAFRGANRRIQLKVPEVSAQGKVIEKTRILDIKIPAGTVEGQKIRLSGQGSPGLGDGKPGDLYLEIHIDSHPIYHVEGRDITLTLPISPWEAALGATIQVPALSGKIALKIPPGSQTAKKLRIKGKGLAGNPAGDLYIILQIVNPPIKSEKDKKLFEEMAQQMAFNPRASLGV